MKVVLTQDVAGLGRRFEVKEIAAGFGRNFLLPQNKAWLATPGNLKKAEQLQKRTAAERQISDNLAAKCLAGLADLTVRVSARANEQGHLFAGLHREDLAKILRQENRLDFKPDHLDLAEPIKNLGEFTIPVRVGEQSGEFKLVVEPSAA